MAISAVTISIASQRFRSSGILNVLAQYAWGALLPAALGCSLLLTAQRLYWKTAEDIDVMLSNAKHLGFSSSYEAEILRLRLIYESFVKWL